MTSRQLAILIVRSALLLTVFGTPAYAQTDSLQLDSTVFTTAGHNPMLETAPGGVTRVELAAIGKLPSMLGNADPLHFAQMLPSMQSSSEIDAGIHIQGCDHQHNLIALNGVPVYGASHLLGLFSVFNPSHFRSMTYSTVAEGTNRLGGIIDMHTQKRLPRSFEMDASLGLVSGQGTLKVPISPQAALLVSGRKSLVNLLYGDYMRFDEYSLDYDFGDVNVTALWNPGPRDYLTLDFYFGDDAVGTSEGDEFGVDLYWKNLLGALHWNHDALEQSLYYSTFALDAAFSEQERTVSLPSHISTLGYKASWTKWPLRLLADVALHEVKPQDPGVSTEGVEFAPEETMRACESSLGVWWSGTAGYMVDWTAGLSAQWYLSPEGRSYFGLSPQLNGTYRLYSGGRMHLRTGISHQYLFQTGLSNLGFPTEFWLPAGRYSDPGWSAGASLAWDRDVRDGMWKLNAELYWRYLGNQLEYVGGLTELMNGSYRLEDALRRGTGRSYGLNLMLQKSAGALTGWAGLSLGRSLRSFGGGTWPSNHERLVELDLVASYEVGRWDLGATLIAAGGTPFTEVREYYLVGGQLVSVFGEHNGARLKPYIRADLSARWHLRDVGRVHHDLVFSLYNASARQQEILRRIVVDRDAQVASYKSMYLGITILPSVGYHVSF